MPFVVTCPTCRHPLTVDEASAGQTVACPTCRAPLAVPAAAVPVQSADPFEPPSEEPRRARRPAKSGGVPVWAVVGALVLLTAGIVVAVALSRGGQQAVAKDEKKDKDEKKVEPKLSASELRAKKVREADAKVMDHFRGGRKETGLREMLNVVSEYKERDPADCGPEESRAVATVYMRCATLLGPQLPEKDLRTYTMAFHLYAMRGGVKPSERDSLGDRIMKETRDAYDRR